VKKIGGQSRWKIRHEASLKEVGVLYPAIADAKGRIIDGIHRLAVDPRWPVFKLPDINTDAKYLLARIIANTHRRTVSAEEKTRWLDELAEATGWTPEKIAKKVGMSVNWVRLYLSPKYKDAEMKKLAEKSHKSRKTKNKGAATSLVATESREPEPTVSTPQPARTSAAPQPSKITEKPKIVTRDPRERYVEGLDLWFIPPSNPVIHALYEFCIEKQIHWHVAVLRLLGLQA